MGAYRIMDFRGAMIKTPVQPSEIKEARKIHAARMKACGGRKRVMTEDQWVGALGELVFHRFLHHMDIKHDWLRDENLEGIDFMIKDFLVDAKTQNTNGWFGVDYWCNVPARQANSKPGDYFILSFDTAHSDMWLCGGITKSTFMDIATFVKKGERHGALTAHEDVYCVQQKALLNPLAWTRTLPADCLPEF